MRFWRVPDKTFTVLVMSDGGQSLRRYTVTGRKLRWILRAGVSLGVLLVGAMVTAWVLGVSFGSETGRVSALERDNQELREKLGEANGEVQKIQGKVASFGGALEKITEYARRLRRFTHLSDPDRNLAMGPVLGRPEQDEEVPSVLDAKEDEAIDAKARERRQMRVELMDRQLGRMDGQSAATQEALEALAKHFKDRQVVLSSTPSIWPARGVFASGFGMRRDPIIGVYSFHKGIDIFAETGTPIVAPADGTVSLAANRGGYGLHVTLEHGFGVRTRFAHMSSVDVQVGQRVKRGDRLGLVGSTGRSTGPHLHYEVLLNGVPQNPFRYILD
jgi:murein DD-endopeptidase MepM/ murein hydrolase activator NlpD